MLYTKFLKPFVCQYFVLVYKLLTIFWLKMHTEHTCWFKIWAREIKCCISTLILAKISLTNRFFIISSINGSNDFDDSCVENRSILVHLKLLKSHNGLKKGLEVKFKDENLTKIYSPIVIKRKLKRYLKPSILFSP